MLDTNTLNEFIMLVTLFAAFAAVGLYFQARSEQG